MTTNDIERLANSGGQASPNFNIKEKLRGEVIPAFLLDLEEAMGRAPAFRRKALTLNLTANDRTYDMPSDFGNFVEDLYIYDGTTRVGRLPYRGEDPAYVIAGEGNTTPGPPSNFWLRKKQDGPLWEAVITPLPDKSYTARGVYYWRIPFADMVEDVDLDFYIPPDWQGALIPGLKIHVYESRTSVKDPRVGLAISDYKNWIGRLSGKKEQAARNRAVFVS